MGDDVGLPPGGPSGRLLTAPDRGQTLPKRLQEVDDLARLGLGDRDDVAAALLRQPP